MEWVTVAGGGSWGTALANLLAENGHDTRLWLRDESVVSSINAKHENPRYLTGHRLAKSLRASNDPSILSAPVVVCAIPCQSLRSWLKAYSGYFAPNVIVVNVAKGLELATGACCHTIVHESLAQAHAYAILSGPSFAEDVVRGQPAAVSLGCLDADLGRRICAIFSNARFRAYYTEDVVGVELGGAMKNVMAIAAGICDALGFGPSTLAALVTRALAEMARIGRSLGAKEVTFMGLSGIGDLTLTCTSNMSRNRRVGLGLGKNQDLESIFAHLGGVSEGVPTTKALMDIAQRLGVDAPLTQAVYSVCYAKRPVQAVVQELLARVVGDERR